MKNLVDHIIDELEDEGIELLEDASNESDYHKNYAQADRCKVKIAITRAVTKALNEER